MDKENFCIEAYGLISGLVEQANMVIDETSHVVTANYADKFKNASEISKRCVKLIEQFLDKWGTCDERLCGALKRIKEYHLLYIVTLDNSSPTLCYRDSKYIADSFYTLKQVFLVKLKKIKEKINE